MKLFVTKEIPTIGKIRNFQAPKYSVFNVKVFLHLSNQPTLSGKSLEYYDNVA